MSDPDQGGSQAAEQEMIHTEVEPPESAEPKPSDAAPDGRIGEQETMRAAQRAANDLQLPDISMLEVVTGLDISESAESPGSSSSFTHGAVREHEDAPRQQEDKIHTLYQLPEAESVKPDPSLPVIAPLETENVYLDVWQTQNAMMSMADGEEGHRTAPEASDLDLTTDPAVARSSEGAISSDTPASIDVKKLAETVAEKKYSIVPSTSEDRLFVELPKVAATYEPEEELDGCIEKLSAVQICAENEDLERSQPFDIPEKYWRSPENRTLVNKFGLPAAGALFQDDNYVLCYDRGRRVPFWVARFLKRDHLKGYTAWCLALYGDKLFWSDFDREELRVIDLNTGKDELVVDKVRIGGMAVDQKNGFLYFTHKTPRNLTGGTIDRVKLDGTERMRISSDAALCPALVPVSGSEGSGLCLLAGQEGGIVRISTVNSQLVKVLETPRTVVLALAYDPQAHIVFYSTMSRNNDPPQIRRCKLTGENGRAEDDCLVLSDVYTHRLAVDYKQRVLYWTDNNRSRIMSTDYEGYRRGVFPAEDPGFILVDTDKRRIFWAERGTGNVLWALLSAKGEEDKKGTLKRGTASRHLKGVVRFHEDEEVPVQFRQKKKHYKSVYDRYNLTRGHIVRAGDCVWNQDVLNRTFRLSQVFPQNKNLNSGLWNELEDKCAQLVNAHGAAIIVAVTIFLPESHKPCIRCDLYPKDTDYHSRPDGAGVDYEDFWVRNRVLADHTAYTDSVGPLPLTRYVHGPHVPTHLAMIILVLNSSGKLSDSDCGEPYAVGAYQFPNTSPVCTDLSHYKRTVKHIEENAGLLFFGKLKEKNIDVDKDLPHVDRLPAWKGKVKNEASSLRTQT